MGQPIILIHGTLSDFREWQLQIDKFAQNYRVISYSRRYGYPNQWIGNGEDNTIPNNVADFSRNNNQKIKPWSSTCNWSLIWGIYRALSCI